MEWTTFATMAVMIGFSAVVAGMAQAQDHLKLCADPV